MTGGRGGSSPSSPDRRSPALESIYQEVILDHYRRPRNQGRVEQADATVHLNNPTCGDEIEMSIRVEDGVVRELRFQGRGCAVSQASASMMSELVTGRTLAAAERLVDGFRAMMRGSAAAAGDRELGDLRALAGVARLPGRVRCAMLGWNAFEEAKRAAGGDAEAPRG